MALPDIREWSGDPDECPGVFEMPSRISWIGRETQPDVREWSKGPPGCPGVVERPSQISGSGPETLTDVREWSGGPPVCPGVVERPTLMAVMHYQISGSDRMSVSDREALPDVCVVGRPSRMSGSRR